MTGLAGTFGTAAPGQVRAPSPAAGSVGIDPMRSDAMALVHRGVLDVQPVDVRLRQAIAQIPLELVEPGDPVRVRQRTHLEPQLVALFGRHGQILASAGRSEEHTSELQSLMR